jgi:hypothetical protein
MVRNFTLRAQQQENWCWATVMQSLFKLRNGAEPSQAAVASDHTGGPCTLDDPVANAGAACTVRCNNGCNAPHSLQFLLIRHGFSADADWRTIPGQNHVAKVVGSIDDDRAVPIMLWDGRNGNFVHFAAIGGYRRHGGQTRFLVYVPAERRDARLIEPIDISWQQLQSGFTCRSGYRWLAPYMFLLTQ